MRMIASHAVSALPRQSRVHDVTAMRQTWHSRLLRFAVLFLGDETEAFRCTQQILLNLKESTHCRTDCTVRVFQTAQRVAQDFLATTQSSRRDTEFADSTTQACRDGSEPRRLPPICWALAQLPADERLVIVLRHFEQIVFDDIARIAMLPTRAVKSQFRNGSLRLCAVLEAAGLLRKKTPLHLPLRVVE